MRSPAKRHPELLLVGVTLFWGSTFIVTKDLVRASPPLVYLAIRFGSAALVLAALFWPRLRAAPRRLWWDAAVTGFGQALGLGFQVAGQVYTTASKSAFVTAFSTALTPLLALVLYGERPRRPQALGVLLASSGLYLLTWPGAEANWNRGDLLSAGCAAVYAWVIVETARRTRHHDAFAYATAQTAIAAALFVGAAVVAQLALRVVAHPPDLLLLETRTFTISGKLVAEITYMALVCTVATFLGQTWAMARMSATHAAVVFALEPVFATGLAIAVEGASEWPGPRGAVGAGLVLCGVVASELRRLTPVKS